MEHGPRRHKSSAQPGSMESEVCKHSGMDCSDDDPKTPRGSGTLDIAHGYSTPPPPGYAIQAPETPPPLLPKKLPRLLRALDANSIEAVQSVLLSDPQAASEPFWDHCWELPICRARRMQCKAGIIELLLANGAEEDLQDGQGDIPMRSVQQQCDVDARSMMASSPFSFDDSTALPWEMPFGLLPSFTLLDDHDQKTRRHELLHCQGIARTAVACA